MFEYASPVFTVFDDIDLSSIAGIESCVSSGGTCCEGNVAVTCVADAGAGENCSGDKGIGTYCDSSPTSSTCSGTTGVDCTDGAKGKVVQS